MRFLCAATDYSGSGRDRLPRPNCETEPFWMSIFLFITLTQHIGKIKIKMTPTPPQKKAYFRVYKKPKNSIFGNWTQYSNFYFLIKKIGLINVPRPQNIEWNISIQYSVFYLVTMRFCGYVPLAGSPCCSTNHRRRRLLWSSRSLCFYVYSIPVIKSICQPFHR